MFIPLVAAKDIAQLLTPWQKSAWPCKAAHGCFFYRLLFSGEFLNCLANSLALFLFALFYKRVEDPKHSNCLILFTFFSRIEENSSTLLYGFFLLFFPCTCLQPVTKEMKTLLHYSGTAELLQKCLLITMEREFPLCRY